MGVLEMIAPLGLILAAHWIPTIITSPLLIPNFFSHGHVTIVLGDARDPVTNALVNVAFLDKIQGFEEAELPIVLNAVIESGAEDGYVLGAPKLLAKHGHDLTGMEHIVDFFIRQVMPNAGHQLNEFVPHRHKYKFPNYWSRADKRLNVFVVQPFKLESTVQLRPGERYESQVLE